MLHSSHWRRSLLLWDWLLVKGRCFKLVSRPDILSAESLPAPPPLSPWDLLSRGVALRPVPGTAPAPAHFPGARCSVFVLSSLCGTESLSLLDGWDNVPSVEQVHDFLGNRPPCLSYVADKSELAGVGWKYIYIYIYTHTHTHTYIYIYTHIYIYIHTYIYIYTPNYIYINTYLFIEFGGLCLIK